MSRGKQFAHLKGATIEETTANILAAHSREVKGAGTTHTYDHAKGKRVGPPKKIGTQLVEVRNSNDNPTLEARAVHLVCSRPMNPAKAQRIAASLHRKS